MEGKDAKMPVVIHWFRKGLRIHDNPALVRAVEYAQQNKAVVRPVFILDSDLPKDYKIGANRYRFLVDSLVDLDKSLKLLGGRLFVLRGKVDDTFETCFSTWNVKLVTFENDTEPYSRARDTRFYKLAKKHEIPFEGFWSHTLYEPSKLIQKNNGQAPKTYQKFLDVMSKAGKPPDAVPKISKLSTNINDPLLASKEYNPPTLEELNISLDELGPHLYPGGESEALKRMETFLSNKKYVENFAKPNTSPNSIEPSTTVLSPYLKFGCLSARLFYEKLNEFKGTKTKPPVSLLGQLYWREFYYLVGAYTPNFTKMEGNTICKQINWGNNENLFNAWKTAQTGYPFIDAIMTQLRMEGWIHHLARHAVACFLTRGDLWQHWEKGQDVFEEYLLDADVYLNAGNWMWLSASAFFHQYYRVYSPIKFGQKTDQQGEYIRKYIPKLAKFPPEYIYEPWRAPISVQKAAGCIIGKDYPMRIVEHETIVKVNLQKMNQAYSKDKKPEDKGTKRNLSLMEQSDDYSDEVLQAAENSPSKRESEVSTDSLDSRTKKKKVASSTKQRQTTIFESIKRGNKK